MNLELLRELATMDPEIPLIFEERYYGVVINLKRPFDRFLTLPSDDQAIKRWSERLFFALLDRIQTRGWFYNLKNYHPGIEPTSGRAIVYTQGDNGIHKSDAENLVEALAHAYVQACKETT